MVAKSEIVFESTPPSIETILRRLRAHTGLPLEYNDEFSEFADPVDEAGYVSFYYEREINGIVLIRFSNVKTSYLLGAAMHVLIELGGKYRGYIPDWTKMKWEEVKSTGNRLPNFTFSRLNRN